MIAYIAISSFVLGFVFCFVVYSFGTVKLRRMRDSGMLSECPICEHSFHRNRRLP